MSTSDMLSSLPTDVLKLVLKFVPLKHRLSSCSLVNKRLQAAATGATDEVKFSFNTLYDEPDSLTLPTRHANSALQWLASHGHLLTRLGISGWSSGGMEQPVLHQLPRTPGASSHPAACSWEQQMASQA